MKHFFFCIYFIFPKHKHGNMHSRICTKKNTHTHAHIHAAPKKDNTCKTSLGQAISYRKCQADRGPHRLFSYFSYIIWAAQKFKHNKYANKLNSSFRSKGFRFNSITIWWVFSGFTSAFPYKHKMEQQLRFSCLISSESTNCLSICTLFMWFDLLNLANAFY